MRTLSAERCVACRRDSPQVTEAEIAELRREIPDWHLVERDGIARLERVFDFPSFADALAFTHRVGALAEEEGANPVGEGQRVGEAREVEDPLEPSDAVAFHQVPVGDLAPELGNLGLRHLRRVAPAGDAPFGRQCPHCTHLPGRLPPGPGSPPTSPDRAPRPLRLLYTSGAVCDGSPCRPAGA